MASNFKLSHTCIMMHLNALIVSSMPDVFDHSACACPVVCYFLHLIEIKWIDFSSCCVVHAMSFLSAIFSPPPPPPPLPMVLLPLIFFSVMLTCLFPSFVGAFGWVALLCQPWGVIHFIIWLPKVKAPGYFRHPSFT